MCEQQLKNNERFIRNLYYFQHDFYKYEENKRIGGL